MSDTIWLLVRNGDHDCYECSCTEHEVIAAYSNDRDAWIARHFLSRNFGDEDDGFDVERVDLDPAFPYGLDGEHFPFRVQLNNNGWCGAPPDLFWLESARAEKVEAQKIVGEYTRLSCKPDEAPFDHVTIHIMARDTAEAIDRAERRYAEWLGPDSPYHTDALRSDLV